MSALDEILAWSTASGPSWVRDALRRVVTQSEISDADIEDLAALCKKPHGLGDVSAVLLPLTADDLPAGGESGPVSLSALTHVSDVNALAPNETVAFGTTGLT